MGWVRHVQDLTILAGVIRRTDSFSSYTPLGFRRVRNAIGRTVVNASIIASIDEASAGLARLRMALDLEEQRRASATTVPRRQPAGRPEGGRFMGRSRPDGNVAL